MKKILTLAFLISGINTAMHAQFIRSELPTQLDIPWEIIYGPDGYLWISENGGIVSRVHPETGDKTIVYTAPDFFGGSPEEQHELCFQPNIGSGTLGMALHPDFPAAGSSYIYYVYSYNSGTPADPATRFKLVRLTWDAGTETVTAADDLVLGISTGYDHLGGRLLAVKRSGIPYLFLSIGDHGISERNSPDCYDPQSTNPNNFAQDPNTDNGKIHRYNIDGTIPADNPIPGNSFYTRGHRNPQGLIYNAVNDILYDMEHGDRTDDEINILLSGKNYGWKFVRGFHDDNNFPGEAEFVSNYTPHPDIEGDALVEPLFAWCSVQQPVSDEFLDWCTVAPSGGEHYTSAGMPLWTNSLLVVTLKNGVSTDQELYRFRLTNDGTALLPSTPDNPNPRKFFGEDQDINGRLRDLAVSPDGKKIYLVNNFGGVPDHITVYTFEPCPQPVITSIETDNNSATISWQSIEGIGGYRLIYTKVNGNGQGTQNVTVDLPPASTSYTITGLKKNKNYTGTLEAVCPPGDDDAFSPAALFNFTTLKGNRIASSDDTEAELSLYPSPATDQISFSLNKDIGPYSIYIYSPEGRLIRTLAGFSGLKGMAEINNLSNGVYLFRIENESGIRLQDRFIKQ